MYVQQDLINIAFDRCSIVQEMTITLSNLSSTYTVLNYIIKLQKKILY